MCLGEGVAIRLLRSTQVSEYDPNIRRTQCAKQYRRGFHRSIADKASLLLGLGHGDLAIHRVCGNPFERIYTRPLGSSRALLVATDCDAAPQV